MPFIFHIEDGQTCPYFRCDVCGVLITQASKAWLLWHHDRYKEKNFQPTVACKECELRLCHDLDCSMELDTALVYLLNNSGMTRAELHWAKQKAGLLGSL